MGHFIKFQSYTRSAVPKKLTIWQEIQTRNQTKNISQYNTLKTHTFKILIDICFKINDKLMRLNSSE